MHSSKTLRIAALGTASDFKDSLLPCVIQSQGIHLEWVKPTQSDILILGSFYQESKRYRWLPKPLRPSPSVEGDFLWQHLGGRRIKPMTVFLTGENIRHNVFPTDYSISFDLTVNTPSHSRLPYWMEMVDWSHEGLNGNCNPRFGALLQLDQLEKPLGGQFLERERKAILLSSHLREPRASCMQALQRSIVVDGFGPHFDNNIKDHHHSGFLKKDLLASYAFNLCPENGLYPGYITEKIPEAFAAGCLPITWVDESISVDFNPAAMINLKPMMQDDFSSLVDILSYEKKLADFMDQPLLLRRPSIEPFRQFIARVLLDAAH